MATKKTIHVGSTVATDWYATLNAAGAAMAGRDLVALDEWLEVLVHENQVGNATRYGEFKVGTVDTSHYVIIRPAPGSNVNVLESPNSLDYGTTGIEMEFTQGAPFTFGYGVSVEDFRIKFINDTWGNFGAFICTSSGTTSSGSPPTQVRRNRVLSQAPNWWAFQLGHNGGTGVFMDNLVVLDGGASDGNTCVYMQGPWDCVRNTFVKRQTTPSEFYGSGDQGTMQFKNNVFINGGAAPFSGTQTQNASLSSNNFSNQAITGVKPTGITVNTGTNALVRGLTDLRPTAAGPLIGAASTSAQFTVDILGSNRGSVPDAGAFQLAAQSTLPTATITSSVLDGQTLTITGTTTGSPTTGSATLPVGGTPNGAIAQGPTTFAVASNAFSITFSNIAPGNYAAPTLYVTNAGGPSTTISGTAFSVMGIDGQPIDDEAPSGTSPLVAVSTAIMQGRTLSATGTVNLQGDNSGTLLAYLDPQPSGTPIGPIAVTPSSGTWVHTANNVAAGQWKLRLVAAANGQSLTVSSATLTILSAVGTKNMPVVS